MYNVARAAPQGAQDRGRRAIVTALMALAALCWLLTIVVAGSPAAMRAMPGHASPVAAALFAGMWLAMMAAMMLPAVTPVVLLFRTVQHSRGARGAPMVPPAIFIGGYLALWVLAGLAAYFVYAAVQAVAARVHAGAWLVPYAGGAILVLAGLYQITPLKNACLTHCRSPLHIVMHGWRDGRRGALLMGATHGIFCLGCCVGLMAVLFVVGLMNLGWMAALSLLIVAEKLAPRGVAIGRAVGALFVALGLLMALQPRLFPAAGLAAGGDTMNMSSPAAMSSTMAIATYRMTAGAYTITLAIGPAEQLLTRSQVQHSHARSGEVVVDSAMTPGTMMPMGMAARQVAVRVTGDMGMAMTNAQVTLSVAGGDVHQDVLPLIRIYSVKEGMKDLHYGANVNLNKGMYTMRVRVNGRVATMDVRVP